MWTVPDSSPKSRRTKRHLEPQTPSQMILLGNPALKCACLLTSRFTASERREVSFKIIIFSLFLTNKRYHVPIVFLYFGNMEVSINMGTPSYHPF